MFIRKSVKRSRFKKAVFITVTVLIAIGLVVPLAGLFEKQPGGSAQSAGTARQSLQERLSDLEARAKENPGDTGLLMELAETYLYAGNADQAVKTYRQVLALDPGNAQAGIEIATIYYYSSKYDQSIAQLQELLKKDPYNSYAHYLYGIVLGTGKKDYAAGAQELEKFVALAKEGPDVEKAKQTIEEWKGKMAPTQK
ncbi:MAG: tetratricopeptide repeat protein [Peptococcaceae bacterium]|nr:tetratricopeptide repeat protein [Peptococcaceae bacterium]